MKPISVSLLALVAAFAQPTSTLKLQEGTVVRLGLQDDLNSAKNQKNETVRLQVLEDIAVNGRVLVAKGSEALGHVTLSEPKGGWGKKGSLEFAVDYVKAVDGANVRIRATAGKESQQGFIRPAMVLGVTGLFIKGKDAIVPKGTEVRAFVDQDKEIVLAPAPAPSQP